MIFFDMLWHASFFVKLIALSLLAMSFYSWVVIFKKYFLIRKYDKFYQNNVKAMQEGKTILQIIEDSKSGSASGNPYAQVTRIIYFEGNKIDKRKQGEGVISFQNNIQVKVSNAINFINSEANLGLNFLATVSSSAPFIGLLGTVWGIMSSFNSIAESGSAELASVAPGLSEALFVTALGLIVAIPALVAYNQLKSKIDYYMDDIEKYSVELFNTFFEQISKYN